MGGRATAEEAKRRATEKQRTWVDRFQDRLPGPARRIVERARRDDILLLSAALAFYGFLSIVPLVILITSVVSLLLGDDRTQRFAMAVGKLAPEQAGADQAIRRVAEAGTRIGVVAFITGLWPATAYGSGLVRAFDRLSSGRGRAVKGVRGRALLLLFLLPLFVLGGILGSYLGSQLLGSSPISLAAGLVIALLTGFVGAAVAIALIYRIFPPVPLGWRAIMRGTVTTATSVSILSLAFTAYLGMGANFKEHYATTGLAIFVLLAVWLFLANACVLVGFKVAEESARR